MDQKFGKKDLETDSDAPRVDYYAKLGYSSKILTKGLLAHGSIRFDLELKDQSRNEVHSNVRKQSSHKQKDDVAADSHLADSVG